jgi:chromosome segregation ATPase
MDQELREYLEQNFSRIDGRFDRVESRLSDMEGRLSGVEGRLDGMEGRLSGVENRLSGMEGRLDGMEGRFNGLEGRLTGVEDSVRHALVLIEGQREDIRQVAEGVAGVNQRLDAFQAEVSQRFEHVQSMIAAPYMELNGRVKVLENSARKRSVRPKAT